MNTDVKTPGVAETALPKRGNRWKHGLYAEHLLAPDEDPDELEELREDLLASMAPQDRLEAEIAANTVRSQWLIRRVLRIQSGALTMYAQALNEPETPAPNLQLGRGGV